MRKLFFIGSIALLTLSVILTAVHLKYSWILIVVLFLTGLGVYDLIQTKHTIRRNFPLVGRTRYLMEWVRPKVYQYFVESDTGGTPFNRLDRTVVYQRAKKISDTTPFGTQLNVYDTGYEWISHSITPMHGNLDFNPRIKVGGPACTKPYSASIFNISAMSYGSLSKNAILALNAGAKLGNFAHNTGEGGLTPYHKEPGGDVIWQIGTGYFGCRHLDGSFNPDKFAERAALPNVKMIEIKLSQGAKPGHGGILPAIKVTPEIADIRLVEVGKEVVSPPYHTAFSTPLELLNFVQKLRELSGGKPVGIKLCIGRKMEFIAICKAMDQTGVMPDFITIDGGEGGTGAAPLEFSNSVGMPLRDGLAFAYDTLNGFALKRHIKLIASGKVVTGFDLVKNIALGADMCNSARGMMMALGCIQALECNTNTCPTGVATQDPALVKGLDVNNKTVRVANFHNQTVKAAVELMAAAGIKDSMELHRSHIYRRINASQIQTYAEMYPYVLRGSLREPPYPAEYQLDIVNSSADSFQSSIRYVQHH